MSALEKFRQRYKTLGRIRIWVPELELEIWSKPYTLHDEAEILQQVGSLDGSDSFIALVIRKAEDEEGRKLFRPDEAIELKRLAEASLIKAIANKIVGSDSDEGGPTPEEKSEATA